MFGNPYHKGYIVYLCPPSMEIQLSYKFQYEEGTGWSLHLFMHSMRQQIALVVAQANRVLTADVIGEPRRK